MIKGDGVFLHANREDKLQCQRSTFFYTTNAVQHNKNTNYKLQFTNFYFFSLHNRRSPSSRWFCSSASCTTSTGRSTFCSTSPMNGSPRPPSTASCCTTPGRWGRLSPTPTSRRCRRWRGRKAVRRRWTSTRLSTALQFTLITIQIITITTQTPNTLHCRWWSAPPSRRHKKSPQKFL